MILEAIFNGEIYPAETVVPKSEKFREAGQAIADTISYRYSIIIYYIIIIINIAKGGGF